MDQSIQISKLNDFIFCPYSLYLHSIYDSFKKDTYQVVAQTRGTIKHKNVDTKKYTTSKNILQGTPIYCKKYNLIGKIDLFDKNANKLIERKYKVKVVYDGYKYQLYAQMFCLQEMGYKVKKLVIHSVSDNKRYNIPLPDEEDISKFEELISQVRIFDPFVKIDFISEKKCKKCIYYPLCDISPC
ncbi:MAG: hypothetical protein US52_C0007G0009 [candidate division WS6 bacterium GW2011_GWA2_37_6]|uniref:DUF83 domain-containing protein n=1 Tax=candidate division WS6 bacterium GW2011_GWA2_37_6 TaxID=1619087 RepID=A0A0G0JHB9_9BACT|nr:MAG: hypothetical protein US52_C0007G0009 [candidate division WS6 bacterium GW2011_GWA2_37_6]